MRGNENNNHQANNGDSDFYQGKGKVAGYALVNLDTRYNIGSGWSVFGKAINIFDVEYNNGGMLGETMINPSTGTFDGNGSPTAYLSPGAPRAGWLGVRYEFAAPRAAQ